VLDSLVHDFSSKTRQLSIAKQANTLRGVRLCRGGHTHLQSSGAGFVIGLPALSRYSCPEIKQAVFAAKLPPAWRWIRPPPWSGEPTRRA
jgi:hypothetical protein